MIYSPPPITNKFRDRLRHLDELRATLGSRLSVALPWTGQLRRSAQAEAFSSSTAIEGFIVPEGRSMEVVGGAGGEPATEGEKALACYAHAMDHVATLARDPGFGWSERIVLDLHFEACRFQRDRSPGLFRDGPISVTAPDGGGIAFTGPEASDVPGLVGEVAEHLADAHEETHVVVEAAMAHLNLVSIHPFEDGNGRISRIIQSLVLAREGVVSPEFGSIESHLARDTPGYYAALMEVQGGGYSPHRDASPWVEYCIEAHIQRATAEIDRLDQAGRRWGLLEELAASKRWDDRTVIALEQALAGVTRRSQYAGEADVSPATAGNDLARMSDAGLLERVGQGRNTSYVPTPELRRLVS